MKRKSRSLLLRWKRYVIFLFQYIVKERIRGLDFTMRNTEIYKTSKGKFHGYSKTNEAHLRDIFNSLSYEDDHNLLDIGCGKGVVLKEAAKYPFKKIAGIDIQEPLVMTAKKNMRILGLEKRVDVICVDAASYDRFKEYDVFFLFNPFGEEVFLEVLRRIRESLKEKERDITIIYHNPVFGKYLLEDRACSIEAKLYDPLKDYETHVYKIKGQSSGTN